MPSAPAKTPKESAVACVSEHLEYFAVVAKHGAVDPDYRRQIAERLVEAVTAITRDRV